MPRPPVSHVQIPLQGRFDLHQSITFGFGQRDAGSDDVMRLAFCLDGLTTQVGVAVRQAGSDQLDLEITADEGVSLEAVTAQVARVLSVDVDARDYDQLGERVPLVGRVQAARPGLRPPLFYSAYEAALWGILSARQPAARMFAAREQLARQRGRVFEVAGQLVAAAPLPAQLAQLDEASDLAGVAGVKFARLRGLSEAADDGRLDTTELRRLDVAEAKRRLQLLAGIGPFYAELITVRALGHTDELAVNEPRIRALAGRLVGADGPLGDEEFADMAEPWRPWRTWVTVAVRAGAEFLS